MKKLTALFLLIISSLTLAGDSSWLEFNTGLQKASDENKHVLIDFYTDWCHWCKVMDDKTFSDPEVAKKLDKSFVKVRVNAEDRNKTVTFQGQEINNVQLTQAFGVTGYPSLAFLDANLNLITLIPGYVPAETFSHILEYIDQKYYEKQMPFDEFVKKMEASK